MKKATTEKSLQAFATQNLGEVGQGIVLVARPKEKGQVDLATFVVDAHCLGVRKVSTTTMPATALAEKLLPMLQTQYALASVSAKVARGIVVGAVDYAKKLGFAAPNLAAAMALFGDEPSASVSFVFGKDGKPFYTQQPEDNEDFAEDVLHRLKKSCGEGGFGFALTDSGEDWLDGDEGEEESGEEE